MDFLWQALQRVLHSLLVRVYSLFGAVPSSSTLQVGGMHQHFLMADHSTVTFNNCARAPSTAFGSTTTQRHATRRSPYAHLDSARCIAQGACMHPARASTACRTAPCEGLRSAAATVATAYAPGVLVHPINLHHYALPAGVLGLAFAVAGYYHFRNQQNPQQPRQQQEQAGNAAANNASSSARQQPQPAGTALHFTASQHVPFDSAVCCAFHRSVHYCQLGGDRHPATDCCSARVLMPRRCCVCFSVSDCANLGERHPVRRPHPTPYPSFHRSSPHPLG